MDFNFTSELTVLVKKYDLDIDANMEDFIIARHMKDSFDILCKANKANGEYFKLSAQEDKLRGCNQCPHDVGDTYERDCSYPDCEN